MKPFEIAPLDERRFAMLYCDDSGRIHLFRTNIKPPMAFYVCDVSGELRPIEVELRGGLTYADLEKQLMHLQLPVLYMGEL